MNDEDGLNPIEQLQYMQSELGPWVIAKLRSKSPAIVLPKEYKLNLYGENTFTLTHGSLIVMLRY